VPDFGGADVSLPDPLESKVRRVLREWRSLRKAERLWGRDPSLWTDADEGGWLGWLGIPESLPVDPLRALAEDVRRDGFSHALLLGMGGSSLCPEILSRSFGRAAAFPALLVLDSTDPAQIAAFEKRIDPARTLFVVSSKSGTTTEPLALAAYFLERAREAVGRESAGRHFLAITDPGSRLESLAGGEGFRAVLPGVPEIGGRFSALSNFGMAPAALMGVDVGRLLDAARRMARACGPKTPVEENPGTVLGTILGVLATEGRDKVTLFVSPRISGLGGWLEQLLAESTGKKGKALIPVDGEPPGPPEAYEKDRLFVQIRLEGNTSVETDAAVDRLAQAGHPVLRFTIEDAYGLGREFFRWEFATAVAGSILGVNPFDQPDVEASKVATRELTAAFEETGALPPEAPALEEGGLRLFADGRNSRAISEAAGGRGTVADWLRAHLARIGPGDYFALLAYVERTGAHEEPLREIRGAVHARKRVATCLGFGPRFLHSTGQAYKGGPNTGVFLQITCEDAADLPIPGQRATFGVVKAAQARGDFQVLAERERRALRVHLGADVAGALARLRAQVERALGG